MDENGDTLLMRAAKCFKIKTIKLFIDHWGDEIEINKQNTQDGRTLVMKLAQDGRSSEILNIIADRYGGEVDLYIRDNQGKTIFQYEMKNCGPVFRKTLQSIISCKKSSNK